MDHIIQALERAKTGPNATLVPTTPSHRGQPSPENARQATTAPQPKQGLRSTDMELSFSTLEKMRIVAHDPANPQSKSFELLRTHLLQAMDANGWRLMAITSPTPACGKTFMALNLALSVARLPDRSILLVDGDLQRPQIAKRLGIDSKSGLRALLDGQVSYPEAITHVGLGGIHFGVMPCERPTSRASDWAGSPQMAHALRTMRTDENHKLVLLDLPPMLSGDETLAILPHVDCVLMVAAAGRTRTTELTECSHHLHSTPLVRVVFNKAPGTSPVYY